MAEKKNGATAANASKDSSGTALGPPASKAEAVRRAMRELGHQANLVEIQAFVKERFNLDMTTDHVSTARGKELRAAAGQKPPRRKRKPRPAAQRSRSDRNVGTTPSTPPAPVALKKADNGAAAILLEDIVLLRGLVERVGPEQLRKLIDVMTR